MSVLPATRARRRNPRDARALLMSRTRCWSNVDTVGDWNVAASAESGAGAARRGAAMAALTRTARRVSGVTETGIWDFRVGYVGTAPHASQPWPLQVKAQRRSDCPLSVSVTRPSRSVLAAEPRQRT